MYSRDSRVKMKFIAQEAVRVIYTLNVADQKPNGVCIYKRRVENERQEEGDAAKAHWGLLARTHNGLTELPSVRRSADVYFWSDFLLKIALDFQKNRRYFCKKRIIVENRKFDRS